LEWVVVDGASTDGSAAWLGQQNPDVYLSERDTGIYDAMNKAIGLSRGEWLFFLNVGDEFADPSTLSDISAVLEQAEGIDVVYGDVLYVGPRGSRRKNFHWLSRRRLLFGDLCHQASFVRRTAFERFGLFDTSLRYNADFDWFLRSFRGGAGLRYVHRLVARFDDGGAHVQAGARHLEERNLVRARYLTLPLWKLGHWALRAELKLRRWAGQEVG
jgi:glycosyltransferase involved in cell wall biosynthesis